MEGGIYKKQKLPNEELMLYGWVRGGESVTDNLSTDVARFPRPRLVAARARATSLRLSHPLGSQTVGFLLPKTKIP